MHWRCPSLKLSHRDKFIRLSREIVTIGSTLPGQYRVHCITNHSAIFLSQTLLVSTEGIEITTFLTIDSLRELPPVYGQTSPLPLNMSANFKNTHMHLCTAFHEVVIRWNRSSHDLLCLQLAILTKTSFESAESWWRHQIEIFPALLALCEGNSPVTGEFPSQRSVMRRFDVFFELRLNNGWANHRDVGDLRHHWFHYDVTVMIILRVNINDV